AVRGIVTVVVTTSVAMLVQKTWPYGESSSPTDRGLKCPILRIRVVPAIIRALRVRRLRPNVFAGHLRRKPLRHPHCKASSRQRAGRCEPADILGLVLGASGGMALGDSFVGLVTNVIVEVVRLRLRPLPEEHASRTERAESVFGSEDGEG